MSEGGRERRNNLVAWKKERERVSKGGRERVGKGERRRARGRERERE